MAGSDGNRGYLVQTLIALFDSLRSETWKRITIEPAHESDKVDVLWDEAKTRKAVQVKSSINQIGMRDVERWATELEAGSSADELKLVLVGPCSGTVAKLRTVGRVLVPCPKNLDFDGFLAEAAHLLDRFLFSVGLECESPDQRELLIRGMTTELSRLSSEALSLDRSAFVSMLEKWIAGISPIPASADLQLAASYCRGDDGAHVHINIFNAGTTPHYLAAWFVAWDGERPGMNVSIECVSGELPFRLREQDKCSFVVNLGDRGFVDLSALGVMDGSENRFVISRAHLEILRQEAERYSVLHQTPEPSSDSESLRNCEMDVKATLETAGSGAKTLLIEVTNKSQITVPLAGADIEWQYDPPRSRPVAKGPAARMAEAQEIGGSINLACRSDLSAGVAPEATVQFFVRKEMSGVFVEFLLGDVPDENISVLFGTNSGVGWKSTDVEISSAVRAYAQYILDFQRSPTSRPSALDEVDWIKDDFAQDIPEIEFADGTNVVVDTDYVCSFSRTMTWYTPRESKAARNWERQWERLRAHLDNMAFVKRPVECTMRQGRTPGYP